MNKGNGFVKRVILYCSILGLAGYLVLHPISMAIVKYSENIPIDHEYDNFIRMAFTIHHLPMGLYFAILCVAFGIISALLMHNISKYMRHIEILEKLLPICANCKAIRDDSKTEKGKGDWMSLETYFSRDSKVEFSHSVCPKCMKELYPEYAK